MKRLRILTLCTIAVSALIFFFKKREATTIAAGKGLVIKKEWLATNKNPLTPKADSRPADQTFLTFPEWYLVFSPEEQANYFKHTTATSFPYMKHTRQIWESYRIVNNQIKGNFPENPGYHFMIWVIGSSASIEYSIKSWYEVLIGRITDTQQVVTAEDSFNARYTQDYVNFIKDRPWYAFDFKKQLFELWSGDVPYFGEHFPRKIERRYILTSELIVKWGYGKLIGLGTGQVYEEALPVTTVITTDGKAQNVPRYDKFAEAAIQLAKEGKAFKEIAGNDSAILLSILVPQSYENKFENTQIVFIQPITSNPTMKRIALAIPVTRLNTLLLELNSKKIQIEHIFDF
ncbi:MAG: hypothetical protein QM783_21350 [Phycisphaerales bacterium]